MPRAAIQPPPMQPMTHASARSSPQGHVQNVHAGEVMWVRRVGELRVVSKRVRAGGGTTAAVGAEEVCNGHVADVRSALHHLRHSKRAQRQGPSQREWHRGRGCGTHGLGIWLGLAQASIHHCTQAPHVSHDSCVNLPVPPGRSTTCIAISGAPTVAVPCVGRLGSSALGLLRVVPLPHCTSPPLRVLLVREL